MKKRNKNAIVIWFLMSISIFLIASLVLYFYIYPWVMEIEWKKTIFHKKIETYNNLLKKWLKYKDFKKIQSNYNFPPEDLYLKDFFNLIKKEKYENLLSEKSDDLNITFSKFLDDKKKFVEEKISSWEIKNKQDIISKILPFYIWNLNSLSVKNWVSDLSFINKIETLLNNYNLKTTSPIWISTLKWEEKYWVDKKEWEIGYNDIYYIPIDLNITWKKKNIISFLRDIQKTWRIKLENGEVKILKNDKIANSEIIEISKISMQKYIDDYSSWWSIFDQVSGLLEYIESNPIQKEQEFEILLNLKFYVKWVSIDKILLEVNKIIWDNLSKEQLNLYVNLLKKKEKLSVYEISEFKKLSSNISLYNKLRKKIDMNLSLYNSSKNKLFIEKIKDFKFYLNKLKPELGKIRNDIKDGSDLALNYKKVEEYKDIFNLMLKKISDYESNFIINEKWKQKK